MCATKTAQFAGTLELNDGAKEALIQIDKIKPVEKILMALDVIGAQTFDGSKVFAIWQYLRENGYASGSRISVTGRLGTTGVGLRRILFVQGVYK